jgi:acetyl-CoA carboxylase, biotin carboxylase subunit
MFKKILIANRGEIAIRVQRAARELGIKTVSIYHQVDKEMPHVTAADYAYELISDSPKSGYLDAKQIIDIAIASGAEAIHPGYGFMSENADFSDACKNNGLVFIGPDAHAIKVMGSKTEARKLMEKAGVPIVPGTKERVKDFSKVKKIATEIGYPIILKAASGGGGKGMKLVEKEEDFISSYESACREALKSFGDDTVYMEKYIVNPKHIEIQMIADTKGNFVYLGERDCSVQRRHQKVIEEAPSTVLTEEIRQAMGKVALDAARACDYHGVGTIEFLLDKNLDFYFLEMNTRLQVEHPVTELITGIDLAKEQIRVAAGLELSFTQEDILLKGHAIECRIYAEDPLSNFMPDIGKINYLRTPDGNGVRVDGGIEGNTEISIHFDPMISKLITFGATREEAITKMKSALAEYKLVGFRNIIPFLKLVMENDIFLREWFDTGFIENHFDAKELEDLRDEDEELMAALAAFQYKRTRSEQLTKQPKRELNNWKLQNIRYRRLV